MIQIISQQITINWEYFINGIVPWVIAVSGITLYFFYYAIRIITIRYDEDRESDTIGVTSFLSILELIVSKLLKLEKEKGKNLSEDEEIKSKIENKK